MVISYVCRLVYPSVFHWIPKSFTYQYVIYLIPVIPSGDTHVAMLKFSWRKSFSVIPSSFISHSSHNLSPLSFRCPSPCSSLLYHNPSFLLLLFRSHLQWLSAHHVVSCCLVHLAIPRRIPLSLARPPIRLVHRCAQSLAWCLNDSFNDWSPLHQGSCCTSLHQYNYSFSMIFVIYSRVKDGFSFCQLHFSLPCPVCCANTHDVYVSTGDLFRYLRNVTTFVQCTYIAVSDLHDVFGVYQWPTQLGGLWLPCIIESLLLWEPATVFSR